MIEDKFGLKDEEYWSDPWRTRKAVQRALMLKNQEGLVLGAPATVALNQRSSFPVALIRVCKLPTLRKIPSRGTVIITALELGTNDLRARLALPDASRQPAHPAQPAAAVPKNGGKTTAGTDSFSGDDSAMASEGHTIDLAAHLRLPAARGQYLVNAILLDKVSNRCRMTLVESGVYDDPAVDDFVREYRASRLKPPSVFPEPEDPLPSYQLRDNSPAIPGDSGIAISVTRVNVFSPGAQCVLTASFRLRIHPQHVVKPAQNVNAPASAPMETARVPISLLLTGSADPTPQILKLTVPSTTPLEAAGGHTIATGYFSLDLCRIANLLVTPQTYFIYAFSGEVMTSAVPTAFVRLPEEDMEIVATR